MLPLLAGIPERAAIGTHDNAPAQSVTDSIPVSVRWNRLVPQFSNEAAARRRGARKAAAGDTAAIRRIPPAPVLFRVYTLLSVAQYAAIDAAKNNRNASSDLAVANASAAILTGLFTDSMVRASIARELARDVERAGTGSRAKELSLASKRIGEDVAGRVVAWAPQFNFVSAWNGTIPAGPGMWRSAPGMPPLGINLASSRAWLLDSASRFRPGSPPAYGSAAWQAALDEVKRIARGRTAEQTRIAQKWDAVDPWAPWNETASAALRRHHASNSEAARVLAVMNIAASDAIIACFEAKYHYWSVRPSQADTTLVLADSVGLPNFPSYPSGHACSAGAFDAVLGHFFPDDRAEFTRIAEEQAMSRLYGGIHYRFDNDTGLELGRIVAQFDIDREKSGGLIRPLL
jgi:hypothetical protein